jgi:hypothetical protein
LEALLEDQLSISNAEHVAAAEQVFIDTRLS